MPTPLSIDGMLDNGLRTHRMSVQEFAKVAAADGIHVSKSRLFAAFNDTQPLDGKLAQELWALWTEIESMCKSFAPFRLSLDVGADVHSWLCARRNGDLWSTVVNLKLNDLKEAQ
jgi:hypothetical protein